MSDFHLAQLNIARLRHPIDAPETKEFVDALDPVNAIAEASPGFVWRLQDDAGNATGISFRPDPLWIVNLTVWESVEALRDFTYRAEQHTGVMRRRAEWFEPHQGPYLVLWWIRAGSTPTIEEAVSRLELLETKGTCPEAFTFGQTFDAPA